MTRTKLSTPPIRGIDLAKFVDMAMKISTETAGGRRGLRAVAPVMDGVIAYVSETMVPCLSSLALLARDLPHIVKPSADGWHVAHVDVDDPRVIGCLLTQDGLTGGWLMRVQFKTGLTDAGRAERDRQLRERGATKDFAADIAGAMKIDGIIDRDPSCHAPALHGDPVREILVSAVGFSGPPPGAATVEATPSPCDASHRATGATAALRIRPRAFGVNGAPCVSAADAGQHGGLPALLALSGLIRANQLESPARDRHGALSGLGWKQFGDAGNACLLGVGMAIAGASEGLFDNAAAARLNRFTRDILAIELRRVLPLVPELAQSLITENHFSSTSAWEMPGGRVSLWLDAPSRRIICAMGGTSHALPLAAEPNGEVVLTSGAIELARVRLDDGAALETDHVGGGILPPPVSALTDILLAIQVAHQALGEGHRLEEHRQAGTEPRGCDRVDQDALPQSDA